jgi:hypothetical protein
MERKTRADGRQADEEKRERERKENSIGNGNGDDDDNHTNGYVSIIMTSVIGITLCFLSWLCRP